MKRLRTNDGQLSLVCSDRNITKIFEITGLDASSRSTRRAEALAQLGVGTPACRVRVANRCAPEWRHVALAAVPSGGLRDRRVGSPGDATAGKTLFGRKCGVLPRHRGRRHGARPARTSTTRSAGRGRTTGFEESTIFEVVASRSPTRVPRPDLPARSRQAPRRGRRRRPVAWPDEARARAAGRRPGRRRRPHTEGDGALHVGRLRRPATPSPTPARRAPSAPTSTRRSRARGR